MTHKQAQTRLLTIPWKVQECTITDCWCALIVPEELLTDDEGNDLYVAASGTIPKEIAKHIVKIHNEYVYTLLTNKS